MKQTYFRWLGTAAALVIAAVSMPFGTVHAENSAADDFEMSILTADTRKDVCSISSLDTAEKDVTIHVGVYIDSGQWPETDYIEAAAANWEASDTKWMHFTNIADLTNAVDQRAISYSGGSYQSRYEPYCFVKTIQSKKYGQLELSRSITETTTSISYEPVFGAEIHQAGENQISFSISYYASKADKEMDVANNNRAHLQKKEYLCDVNYDAAGTAYYTYSYIRQDNYQEDVATGYLPEYSPDLEVGKPVPGMSDFFMWMYSGTSATSFFGESSDEFPLITFDVVLKKGTPEGRYSVDLTTDEARTFLSGKKTKMSYPASANGLTILVDANAPRMTEPAVTETTTTTTTTETAPETTTTVSETVVTAPVTSDISPVTTEPQTTTSVPATIPSVTTTTETTTTVTTTVTATNTTTTAMQLLDPYLVEARTMYVDELATLTLYNANTNSIVWLSNDPTIVKVRDKPFAAVTLEALRPGTATVYVVATGKVYTCEVTVKERNYTLTYGDVNRDGKVGLNDIVLSAKSQADVVSLGYYARRNADCNANGIADAEDIQVLLRFLVHEVENLPVTDGT